MSDIAIKIDHVSKEYRLGAIGGTTLREEFHRLADKLFHRESMSSDFGKKFMALQDINLEVRKGERLGIIGHNGAGKSTLLKLLARVTGPTTGTIAYNGRISSMLEVGTGFHGELTGRENIYMNGAILGMSKREIDSKIDQIIEFAEMEKFIDTPVKRYSSGMYVKLAFAVAAHLDNEILIMDEVLAVGDMKFQQKCLGKMGDASAQEGKTVLYVSHNMNTIRHLCERCIVLDHGHITYDGNVEKAIDLYMGLIDNSLKQVCDFRQCEHFAPTVGGIRITGASMDYPFCQLPLNTEIFEYTLDIDVKIPANDVYMRLTLLDCKGNPIGIYNGCRFELPHGEHHLRVFLPLPKLLPGIYGVRPILYRVYMKNVEVYDQPFNYARFEVAEDVTAMNTEYTRSKHGFMLLGEPRIVLDDEDSAC